MIEKDAKVSTCTFVACFSRLRQYHEFLHAYHRNISTKAPLTI